MKRSKVSGTMMLGVACETRGPGVYAIVALKSANVYVGSSVNIHQRWQQHRSQLRKGTHHCPSLQAEWNEALGEAFFAFVVLERTPSDYAVRVSREQWWIDSTPCILNTSGRAGSGAKAGGKRSHETRARIAAALKGKKKSPEHIERHAAAIRGKKNPGVSRALKGVALSVEHRKKISASQLGKVRKEGTGEKISAALKGRTRSPEHALAISAAKRGRLWSESRRASFDSSRSSS